MLLLDPASNFAALLERQAIHSTLQLLSYLLTVSLGQAVHDATLHPAHTVHKLVVDHASDVLHAVSKLGLLLAYLIPMVSETQTCCEYMHALTPSLLCAALLCKHGVYAAESGWQHLGLGVLCVKVPQTVLMYYDELLLV